MLTQLLSDMFVLPLPILEKILRSLVVYIFLIILLRVFGKRELAQVNPFDLVVLLTLSNAVQNAIIGEDNSITGGMIGAVTLVGANWLFVKLMHKYQKLDELVEGSATPLIKDGELLKKGLKEETLTENELLAIINRQGFSSFEEVSSCVLETNGTFAIIGKSPSADSLNHREVMEMMNQLRMELAEIKQSMKPGLNT